jgi:hypothetical protein
MLFIIKEDISLLMRYIALLGNLKENFKDLRKESLYTERV